MGAYEVFSGGSEDVGARTSYTLGTYGARVVRVRNTLSPQQRTLTLAAGQTFTTGGPVYIISNGSTDVTQVRRSDDVVIGTVAAGATGYMFLLDAYANSGSGEWLIAGNGTAGEVGDQDDPLGFNYGTATNLRGLEADMGTSDDLPVFTDGREMNFGNATIATATDPDNL